MREYTSSLASRVEQLSEEQEIARAAGETSTAAARADTENAEYRERYLRVRGEYRELMRSRVDSLQVTGSAIAITTAHHRLTTSTSPLQRASKGSKEREQQALLAQLEGALSEEAELHRAESQRLNEELYQQERARYQPPYPMPHPTTRSLTPYLPPAGEEGVRLARREAADGGEAGGGGGADGGTR